MAGEPVQRSTEVAHNTALTPSKSKFVAAVFVVWGALLSVVGLVFVAFSSLISDIPVSGLQEFGIAISLIFFLFALIDFVVAYGIWNVTEWGWMGGLIISSLATVLYLLGVLGGAVDVVSIALLGVTAFCVWALWDERAAFR